MYINVHICICYSSLKQHTCLSLYIYELYIYMYIITCSIISLRGKQQFPWLCTQGLRSKTLIFTPFLL